MVVVVVVVVVGGVDLLAEGGCGGGRGGEADEGAAAVLPGGGEGAHGGGLARSGGRDRELEPVSGGRHGPDQSGLSGVEGDPVRGHLQQGEVDRLVRDGVPVEAGTGGDDPLFRGQHPRGGVEVGAVDGVDAGPVLAAQQWGFGDAVTVRRQPYGPVLEDLSDELVDDVFRGPGTARCRGRQVRLWV